MLTRRSWIGVAVVAAVMSSAAFTPRAEFTPPALITPAAVFAPLPAEAVAVIVQVTGKVQVKRSGTPKPLGGTVGLSLLAGDSLVVPGGAKAVVMYRTGQMQTASSPMAIREPVRKDAGSLYARTVNTITQVAATDAAKQPNRQGMIRPIDGAPAGIAPRNSLVVLDLRPQLTWFSVPGAKSYTVQLIRRDVQGLPPVRFSAGGDTAWTYPASAPALAPGATYEWIVGVDGGRIGAQQMFRTVSAETFASIAETIAQLQAAGVDPATDGSFVLALAYRDAGLMYEANGALERMAKAGGGNGRMYHLLRGEILDALGDLEGAAREFIAADAESDT